MGDFPTQGLSNDIVFPVCSARKISAVNTKIRWLDVRRDYSVLFLCASQPNTQFRRILWTLLGCNVLETLPV